MALANLTRPIDDYVHRKLKNPNTRIQGNEDLEFAHTMRELLSDVALSITQNRIDNLHKSMGLPGRLDALLVAKRLTARNRRNNRSYFCRRYQTAFGTTSSMAQTSHNATPNTANNNQTTQSYKGRNFQAKGKTRALSRTTDVLPGRRTALPVLSSMRKVDKQPMGQKNSREKIQDYFQKSESREAKGFDDKKLYKFQRNNQVWSSDDPSSTLIQAENKQGSQRYNNQGGCGSPRKECNRAEDLRPALDLWKLNNFVEEMSGAETERGKQGKTRERYWQVQGKKYGEYKKTILQTKPTGVQDQDVEVQYDTTSIDYSSGDNDKLTKYEFKSLIRQGEESQTRGQQTDQSLENNTEKLGKLYWKGTSNVGGFPPWLPNAEETFGIEKQFLEKSEIMDCHGDSEQSSNSELIILDTESAKMEQIVVGSQFYSELWPLLVESAHINVKELLAVYYALQLHSAVDFYVLVYLDNTTTLAYVQKFEGTTSRKLLEVSEKLWSHYVLCTNVHQPGRRAIKNDSSNGMVSINRDIQETEQNIWPIRRGSVCNKTEQEAAQILQLVPGQSISRSQRTELLLFAMGQPLLLSPVESNTTDPTEDSTGKDNYDNNYANVEVCDLRQISTTQKQILVADGMENQRRTLQQEGLTDLALDLITANTRSVKRRSRYYTTQKEFIDWRHGLGISGDITEPDIINYLSKIFIERKSKQSTIKAYKSALLQFVTDKERVEKEKCFIKFMKFLNESDLLKVTNIFINIKPIIDHFKISGPTNNLKTKELTAKTCWLIAVCGTGISTDAILTQENWPSYYMFSSY
ncbi:hypothetical protein BB561_005030 [Smittium simulii]|uniref:Core-binding (CB) domain-containing protein n=1 Tax=Smittium simulii TaxID=133385 RepID=A0A2T9YCP8_9FUNG|nr:hypothetical protein BB561_005030 [Smittium simulii]